MQDILFSLAVFVIVYLFYLIAVIRRKNKLDKLMEGVEVTYIKKRYKLSLKNVDKKTIGHLVAFTNSLIFAIAMFIVSFVKNYILKLLVAFIVLVPSIILAYHLIGLYLKRSEKDV